MASYLFTDNQLEESNISSITHTASLGSITGVTDKELVSRRSVLRAYQFTYTSVGTKTFTINLTSTIGFTSLSILGLHGGTTISSVRAYNGGSLLASGDQVEEQVRYISGVTIYDFAFTMDSAFSNCNKIIITYVDASLTDGRIGTIHAGNLSYTPEISPKTMRFTFAEQGTKMRTEGGQIVAGQNNAYMKASFTTTASKASSFARQAFDINYIASTSEPIVFIPNSGDNIIFYGTQEKLNSTQPTSTIGKQDGEWLYQSSFNLEEEF